MLSADEKVPAERRATPSPALRFQALGSYERLNFQSDAFWRGILAFASHKG